MNVTKITVMKVHPPVGRRGKGPWSGGCMSMHAGWGMMRSMTRDSSIAQRKLAPGTAKRVIAYARPYKAMIALFLVVVILDSALVVATPLLLGQIIDKGVILKNSGVVVRLSLIIAVIAVLDGALTLVCLLYTSPSPRDG